MRQSYEQRQDATVTCSQNSVSVKCLKPNEFAYQRLPVCDQKVTAGTIE